MVSQKHLKCMNCINKLWRIRCLDWMRLRYSGNTIRNGLRSWIRRINIYEGEYGDWIRIWVLWGVILNYWNCNTMISKRRIIHWSCFKISNNGNIMFDRSWHTSSWRRNSMRICIGPRGRYLMILGKCLRIRRRGWRKHMISGLEKCRARMIKSRLKKWHPSTRRSYLRISV